jgi:hypothetical protein
MLDGRLFTDKIFVLECFDVAEHLRRKRLVNFPERNVIEIQPVSRQYPSSLLRETKIQSFRFSAEFGTVQDLFALLDAAQTYQPHRTQTGRAGPSHSISSTNARRHETD